MCPARPARASVPVHVVACRGAAVCRFRRVPRGGCRRDATPKAKQEAVHQKKARCSVRLAFLPAQGSGGKAANFTNSCKAWGVVPALFLQTCNSSGIWRQVRSAGERSRRKRRSGAATVTTDKGGTSGMKGGHCVAQRKRAGKFPALRHSVHAPLVAATARVPYGTGSFPCLPATRPSRLRHGCAAPRSGCRARIFRWWT